MAILQILGIFEKKTIFTMSKSNFYNSSYAYNIV